MLKKNTAGQFIYFVLQKLADGTPFTGETPDGYVTIDDGAQGGIGGSIAEKANGQYAVALSQGDTNGDEIGYLFTNAGAVPISITITTETKKMADLNDFAVDGEVTLKDNAITLAKYDESTAWPLRADDAGASYVARTGADGDTLEVISDEIDAVPGAAAINEQVDIALSDIHLDHVLAVDFDADAPVGNATSFLRQLMEVDSSLVRFTEASLANSAAAGGDATQAKQDEILVDIVDIKGSGFVKDTNSLVDLHLSGAKVLLSDAAITADAHDLSTAYCITAADAGATQIARVGADGDTLEILSDEIALIAGDATAAKQDEILVDLVDIKGTGFVKDTHSLYDIQVELAVVDGNVDDVETLVTTIDGKADTISTAVVTTLDTVVDSILTDTVAIQKLLRADLVVDDNETPYEYLYIEEGTENVLMTKEMYEVDDTDITSLVQVVAQLLKP
jgi:hypothetical protein